MRNGHSLVRMLLLLGRLIVAAVFLFAAYAKFHAPFPFQERPFAFPPLSVSLSYFALQIDSYQLLPPWGVALVAHTVPWLELAVGALLVVGYPLRTITTVASLLLLGFFSVMVRTYFKGLEINCGCFGPGETLGVKTLVRDGLLLAISLAITIGAFFGPRRKASEAQLSESAQAK